MKLTGDYTLFLGKEKSDVGRQVTSIEFKQVRSGTAGGKPIKTFDLRYTSAHGSYYDERIGMVFSFVLRDNSTGKKTIYWAGHRPYTSGID